MTAKVMTARGAAAVETDETPEFVGRAARAAPRHAMPCHAAHAYIHARVARKRVAYASYKLRNRERGDRLFLPYTRPPKRNGDADDATKTSASSSRTLT